MNVLIVALRDLLLLLTLGQGHAGKTPLAPTYFHMIQNSDWANVATLCHFSTSREVSLMILDQ